MIVPPVLLPDPPKRPRPLPEVFVLSVAVLVVVPVVPLVVPDERA